jgi:ribosome-associated protein
LSALGKRDPAAKAKTGAGEKRPKRKLSSRTLARRMARAALAKKAEDVILLDLRELSSACDYFVLATGLSDPQVRAITEQIEETLAGLGYRPWHVEGRANRKWVLLDYVDVVVHVFHRDTREYYRLESLWADAPREVVGGGASATGAEEE